MPKQNRLKSGWNKDRWADRFHDGWALYTMSEGRIRTGVTEAQARDWLTEGKDE